MNMTKKMKFEKNEGWKLCTFYYIYMNNDIKMIKIIGTTDRGDTGKNYLSWLCTYCAKDCEMPLENFLLWDVYYQKNFLLESCKNIEMEMTPLDCYNQANEWIKGDGHGSYFKKLLDLTENISCGYYYGY